MRQSAAHSRHQLLPVRGVCAACKWCIAASRWCSDVNVSNGAYGPRSPTQTRPFSSVSALVAAAFGPAVGSAACRVRSGDTRAACIRTRAAGAASGCAICSSSPWQSTAWQAQQDFAATADWRVSTPRVRQSTAQSRHQLLPAPCMCCTRRMRMVRISAEAFDADTGHSFVSIGARSGSIRCCGWFSRISSRPWQ